MTESLAVEALRVPHDYLFSFLNYSNLIKIDRIFQKTKKKTDLRLRVLSFCVYSVLCTTVRICPPTIFEFVGSTIVSEILCVSSCTFLLEMKLDNGDCLGIYNG